MALPDVWHWLRPLVALYLSLHSCKNGMVTVPPSQSFCMLKWSKILGQTVANFFIHANGDLSNCNFRCDFRVIIEWSFLWFPITCYLFSLIPHQGSPQHSPSSCPLVTNKALTARRWGQQWLTDHELRHQIEIRKSSSYEQELVCTHTNSIKECYEGPSQCNKVRKRYKIQSRKEEAQALLIWRCHNHLGRKLQSVQKGSYCNYS